MSKSSVITYKTENKKKAKRLFHPSSSFPSMFIQIQPAAKAGVKAGRKETPASCSTRYATPMIAR